MNSVKLQWIRLIDRNMLHSNILMKIYQKDALKIIPFSIASKRMVTIKKRHEITSWTERGREPSCTVSKNVNWCSLCGKLHEVLLQN